MWINTFLVSPWSNGAYLRYSALCYGHYVCIKQQLEHSLWFIIEYQTLYVSLKLILKYEINFKTFASHFKIR